MNTLIVLGVGVIIGWQVPQPPWAKIATDFAIAKIKEAIKNASNKPS